MKILLIHNSYQQYGGEDAIAFAEKELLEQRGEQLTSYTRHNDEIKQYTFLQKLQFASNTVYSSRTTKELTALVEKSRPDVAYIHNAFPLISPSVYHILHSLKVPSVQVIHDFRFFCPNGWFYTNGHICERCKRGSYINALRYRCYRDSYALSALYSASIGLNRLAGMLRKVTAFICLTAYAKLKLLEAGVPDDKLFIRPNFIDAARITPCAGNGDYIVYMGRLSSEKGLWTLVRTFEALKGALLKIVGTGPLEAALKAYVRERQIRNIEFVGFKSGAAKWKLLRNSLFVVVPSEWYDMFPTTVLEAYAAGKPVVASDIGGLASMVIHGKSGMLFPPGAVADLTEKVLYLMERPAEIETLGRYGRELVEREYGPDRAYKTLMAIFDKVSGQRQALRKSSPDSFASDLHATKTMMAAKNRLRIGVIGMRGIPSHYSGIERAAESLYPRLADLGHDITIYCRRGNPECNGHEYRHVRLVPLPSIRLRSVETLSHSAVSLAHALLCEHFDLVHLHALAPGLFSMVRRISRVPVVVTIHGLDWQRAKWHGAGSALLKLAEKLIAANADQIIVVSRDLQAYFQRTYSREVVYIPNGVEGKPEACETNGACLTHLGLVPREYIAYIGRLVPEKRIEDLVLAFRTVNTTHKLAIVGEGGYTDPYVRRLRECAGSDSRVLFTGLLRGSQLDAVFRNATAFVLPSAMEGLPMGLLECMNYGIPAIASDIPPHRELLGAIPDYDLFFNPGDVKALSLQLSRILAAPESYDRVSALARDHVRASYSWPEIAARTEAVLMQAVASPRVRHAIADEPVKEHESEARVA